MCSIMRNRTPCQENPFAFTEITENSKKGPSVMAIHAMNECRDRCYRFEGCLKSVLAGEYNNPDNGPVTGIIAATTTAQREDHFNGVKRIV